MAGVGIEHEAGRVRVRVKIQLSLEPLQHERYVFESYVDALTSCELMRSYGE